MHALLCGSGPALARPLRRLRHVRCACDPRALAAIGGGLCDGAPVGVRVLCRVSSAGGVAGLLSALPPCAGVSPRDHAPRGVVGSPLGPARGAWRSFPPRSRTARPRACTCGARARACGTSRGRRWSSCPGAARFVFSLCAFFSGPGSAIPQAPPLPRLRCACGGHRVFCGCRLFSFAALVVRRLPCCDVAPRGRADLPEPCPDGVEVNTCLQQMTGGRVAYRMRGDRPFG